MAGRRVPRFFMVGVKPVVGAAPGGASVCKRARAADFESGGRRFESVRARHKINGLDRIGFLLRCFLLLFCSAPFPGAEQKRSKHPRTKHRIRSLPLILWRARTD